MNRFWLSALLLGLCSLSLTEGDVDGPRVIKYKISNRFARVNDVNIRAELEAQMKVVEDNSCFKFVEDRDATSDYTEYAPGIFGRECVPGNPYYGPSTRTRTVRIYFRPCVATANRNGVESLRTEFLRAVMYSLGFVDEVLRPDRDDYVQFIPACFREAYTRPAGGRDWHFTKKAASEIPYQAPNVSPYDINSVMQQDTVYADGCPVFLNSDLTAVAGARNRTLSAIDKQRLDAICK